jgi:eukaryotic-like serine/threonine-protein kinase
VVREPIMVEHGDRVVLTLAPPPAARVPDGFVYIAPGTFLYGAAGDDATRRYFLSAPPRHVRRTNAFLIARTEVTFAQWIAYLEATPTARPPSTPRKLSGAVQLERRGGAWQLTITPTVRTYTARWGQPIRYQGRDRNVEQDWRNFPVVGVSGAEAEAFAAWLDRTRRIPGARLCSEVEWERAARGSDGRTTPTGEPLEGDDANFDTTYPYELRGPDAVGSHPRSASPYGLLDMMGNAFEVTRGEDPGTFIGRGGSFFHDRLTAHLANHAAFNRDQADATTGIRLCASVAP